MTRNGEPTRPVVPEPAAPTTSGRAPGAPGASLLALQRGAGNQAMIAKLVAPAPVLARRRMPGATDLDQILFDIDAATGAQVAATDGAAHQAGLRRLLSLAKSELTTSQLTRLTSESRRGLTAAQWAALTAAEQDLREARALLRIRPRSQLGDPLLIDSGPRPGTRDSANLQKLVDNANAIFATIATGGRDMHLAQVFGALNVGAAKIKYANARAQMNTLHTSGDIVTDRSGYNAEVDLGGLTSSALISLEPSAFDRPDSRDSIVTMIHESMHAGNPDVDDNGGYIDREQEFRTASEPAKLTNAAHFEVVPRRMLGMQLAYRGVTFVPPGTTVGTVTAPPLTPRQQAVEAAGDILRDAWTIAMILHTQYVSLLRTPAEWATLDLATRFGGVAAGTHFADALPFWSKVEKLTIHDRASISPAARDASRNPVTHIDVAISEGVIRKLADAMDRAPGTAADAGALESAHLTPAKQTAAAASVSAERDALIRLVLEHRVGSITGLPARDFEVVMRLGQTPNVMADILAPRAPAAFPF